VNALWDPNCKHIFFAAWKNPAYICLLQTASSKVAVVESSAMGPGIEAIPLPCSFIQFPGVFSITPKVDRLVNDYSTFGAVQSLGSLVAKRAGSEVLLSWLSIASG